MPQKFYKRQMLIQSGSFKQPGDLVVKSNQFPRSGSVVFRQLQPIHQKVLSEDGAFCEDSEPLKAFNR